MPVLSLLSLNLLAFLTVGCSSGISTAAEGSGGNGTGTGGAGNSGSSGSGGASSSGGVPGSGGSADSGGSLGSGGANAGGGPAGGAGGAGMGGGVSGAGGSAAAAGQPGGGSGGSSASGGNSGGAGSAGSCTTPPPAGPLIGWASLPGMGETGTTGGGTTAPITVTTAAAFISNAGGTTPRVIHVMGKFSGVFSIGSNKTIIGVCGAQLKGHVSLSRATNVIVRNLTILGNNCADSPNECSGGADAVTVGDGSHHVWFDHDDVYDGSDGNMDITSGADFVTVSWTKFHYTTKRTDPMAGTSGHRFSNLIGSADDVPGDVGHLNVTFHHNWWAENVDQRMPRTRHGKIHVFNNLFTAAGNNYCTNAGFMASLLVESNVYRGVKNPLQPADGGQMRETNNVFDGTTGTKTDTGSAFTPTYPYTPDPTDTLPATIMAQVGPH
ncbi:MAG: hypothetical protein ABIW57_05620 [Polyangia bacterium]